MFRRLSVFHFNKRFFVLVLFLILNDSLSTSFKSCRCPCTSSISFSCPLNLSPCPRVIVNSSVFSSVWKSKTVFVILVKMDSIHYIDPCPWFIQHHRCIGPHVEATNVCLELMLQPLLRLIPFFGGPSLPHLSSSSLVCQASPESRNFPVQRLLRNASILVTRPSRRILFFGSPSQEVFVLFFFVLHYYFVPPGDTKNASQSPVVCCFQFLAQCDGKRSHLCTIEDSR